MVEYYNITNILSNNEGYISILSKVSIETNYYAAYALLALVFFVPIIYRLRKAETEFNSIELVQSLNLASLYCLLLSSFMFVGNIIVQSSVIFFFGFVFVATAAVKFYKR